MKTVVKQYESDLEMNSMDIEDIVLSAFSSFTNDDCMHWTKDFGIYNVL